MVPFFFTGGARAWSFDILKKGDEKEKDTIGLSHT
jgi:hypothetical protein